MEYDPRYPQPFTLTQAIALDPAVASDEIDRLRNSLLHLKRSQSELQQYLQELASEEGADIEPEISQALKENEITMHDERVFMLKLALTHHGYSATSEPSSETLAAFPATPPEGRYEHSQVAFGSNSNGLEDEPTSGADSEIAHVEEQENGVYL